MSLDISLTLVQNKVAGQPEKAEELEVYSDNITHNLKNMARAAGLQGVLWEPEELGYTVAAQLIAPLTLGLIKLKADPVGFAAYNAVNGWGLYEHFVPFVENFLHACIANPKATVSVSR